MDRQVMCAVKRQGASRWCRMIHMKESKMRKTVFSLIGIVILVLVVGMVSASAPFDIVGECPDKFTLSQKAATLFPETDRNGDGYACAATKCDQDGLCDLFAIVIDNNVRRVHVGECPDKFTLSQKAATLFPKTDRNGDGYACSATKCDPDGLCDLFAIVIDNNVMSIDK
jgi:hypothetical protein